MLGNRGVGVRRQAGAVKTVELGNHLLDEVRAHLHLADTGLRLCVGTAEVRTIRRV